MSLTTSKLPNGKPRTCPKCGLGRIEHVVMRKRKPQFFIAAGCDCEEFRLSGYYKNSGEAQQALKEGNYGRK